MNLDLKLLHYAVVLARHRHFGQAAAALDISQPTLSRNIAALERQLGMRLFERSNRDVMATPAGEDTLRMAEELIVRSEALSNRLELVRDGRGGRLRVVAGAYIDDIAVQPAAIELIVANPSIRLEILEREWTAALSSLMSDQADFAVADILALRDMPSLRVESLGVLQGVYFCRAGHPLLMKPDPVPDDLRNYPFVMPGISLSRISFIADFDSGMKIDERGGGVLPSIAVSSFRSAIDIVAATDAISLGHPTQIAKGIAAGRFALLHLPWMKKLPSAEMGVAWKRERTLLPAARAFIKLIRKHVRNAQAVESPAASRRTRRPSVGA
ncbi:MAG: LysR family transcriptional regulator [Reyranella sp.]|uniref:LysR family transcriptional regulator n=1 Tax=Reyranella sp. TaxID=1929291 RepID=UPI00120F751F|nr:LysR family transcriptional regulator [Reyranella sp.]TAJ87160.1 MAG: LysR family transcriptional regulator [Reyranella sp.]TBR23774.1 MAG: LysR family transcriptional regulator [Reyranella sp.]